MNCSLNIIGFHQKGSNRESADSMQRITVLLIFEVTFGQNLKLNSTKTKEFEWILNDLKKKSINKLIINWMNGSKTREQSLQLMIAFNRN